MLQPVLLGSTSRGPCIACLMQDLAGQMWQRRVALCVLVQAEHLSPPRFSQDDTLQLVTQLCDEWERAGVERCMDIGQIAASVTALTAGHRGLTGQCLYMMQHRLRSGEPLTAQWWINEQSILMPYVLGNAGNVTYARIVSDLVKIQDEVAVQEVIDELMRTGGE